MRAWSRPGEGHAASTRRPGLWLLGIALWPVRLPAARLAEVGRRVHGQSGVNALWVFRIALVLVLWYFLAGLIFSRWLQIWPAGFEEEGFFLVSAALPWSLLTLDFYQQADSALGAAVRDILFLLVLGFGIAANVTIAALALKTLVLRLALDHTIQRHLRAMARPRSPTFSPPISPRRGSVPDPARGRGRR